jgi:hypothetical protein
VELFYVYDFCCKITSPGTGVLMGCRDSLFFINSTFVHVKFSEFGIKFSKNSLFLAKKECFINTN